MKKFNLILIKILLFINLLVAIIFYGTTSQAHTSQIATQESILRNILLDQNYIPVTLEFASKHNSLICMGTLDKTSSQPLLIDTGATTTNIDPISVKKAGLTPKNESIVAGGGDNLTHRAYKLTIPTLQLGNFIAHNEPSVILDQSPKKIDKRHIMATLGMTFFRKHQSIIDIRGQHLYLKADTKKAHLDSYHDRLIQMRYVAIPLVMTPSGHVIIKTQVNNSHSVNMLFDSGVPFTMLSADFAKKLKLKTQSWIVGGGAGGGKIIILKTHIKTLTTESISWTPSFVGVMDFKNIKVKTSIAGVIGLDWMQANNAIIDASNNMVFIRTS